MCPVHLDIPVGADHQHPHSVQSPGEVLQEIDGCCIRVVQVFEHDQQWQARPYSPQEITNGLHQAIAILIRVSGRSRFDAQAVTRFGHYPRYVPCS